MDTRHFVLMCCAFIVIATWMLTMSDWAERPIPIPPPAIRYACSFDGYCKAGNCSAPLPPDIVIVPEDHEGRAYFYNAGAPLTQYGLQMLATNEFFGRIGQAGSMRLLLRETGALTATEYAGVTKDTEILATATGQCQQIDAKPQGQN